MNQTNSCIISHCT